MNIFRGLDWNFSIALFRQIARIEALRLSGQMLAQNNVSSVRAKAFRQKWRAR
jgi:hypothetical protein